MFDIGWQEILVIGVVALVVIGPKDLPRTMRTAGRWMRKAKTVTHEFKRHVDDMMRESELDEVRRNISEVTSINPGQYIEHQIDPDKKLRESLEFGGEDLVNVTLPPAPAAPAASASPAPPTPQVPAPEIKKDTP
jgi:sec-independent protein translocase protein TatB